MRTPRRVNLELRNALATRLRALRYDAHLSAARLSVQSGISRHTIQNVERASHATTMETLADLARGLGCPLDDLVGGLWRRGK